MIANFDNYQNILITEWEEDDRGLPKISTETEFHSYNTADLVLVRTREENIFDVFKDSLGNNRGKKLNIPSNLLAKYLLKESIK